MRKSTAVGIFHTAAIVLSDAGFQRTSDLVLKAATELSHDRLKPSPGFISAPYLEQFGKQSRPPSKPSPSRFEEVALASGPPSAEPPVPESLVEGTLVPTLYGNIAFIAYDKSRAGYKGLLISDRNPIFGYWNLQGAPSSTLVDGDPLDWQAWREGK